MKKKQIKRTVAWVLAAACVLSGHPGGLWVQTMALNAEATASPSDASGTASIPENLNLDALDTLDILDDEDGILPDGELTATGSDAGKGTKAPVKAEGLEAPDDLGDLEEITATPSDASAHKKARKIMEMIARLPSPEEVEDRMLALEDDEDALGRYLKKLSMECRTIYAYYEELDTEGQKAVENIGILMDLSFLWDMDDYATENGTRQQVFQINCYSSAANILIHGGSVKDKLGSGMSYAYWSAVTVDEVDGELRVTSADTAQGDKRSCKASTDNGFVLLVYGLGLDVSEGDYVKTDINYTAYKNSTAGYRDTGYGTVLFSTEVFEEDPFQEEKEGKEPKDNTPKLHTVQAARTRDKIQIDLYDYDADINNKYDGDKKYPGFQQGGGTTNVGSSFRYGNLNFGDNITEDLGTIRTVANKGGKINVLNNGANSPLVGAMRPSLVNGAPMTSDGASMDYLFTDSEYATKINQKGIDGLFQFDEETGMYHFDSRENNAQYNPEDDTFTLYEEILTPNFIMYPFGNFLPFNDIVHDSMQTSLIDRDYIVSISDSARLKYEAGGIDNRSAYNSLSKALNQTVTLADKAFGASWKGTDLMNKYFSLAPNIPAVEFHDADVEALYSIDYDVPKDFFFGMTMSMEFMQPKNGMTGPNGDQEMIYHFRGDDDVLIYIDGKLFLDLSGIHRHVGGTIDFKEGEVHYYSFDPSTGDVSTTEIAGTSKTFSELTSNDNLKYDVASGKYTTFKDYSTHTLQFFYMERGAGSGVCMMEFNMPLREEGSLSVTKSLSVDEGNVEDVVGNQDFSFQFMDAGTDEPALGEGIQYQIQDAKGNPAGSGVTGADGVFRIKSGQTAVFSGLETELQEYYVREILEDDVYEQYDEIMVDGEMEASYSYVDLEGETWIGVDSAVKDSGGTTTAFVFNNQATVKKMETFRLKKVVRADAPKKDSYTFHIEADGIPLQEGLEYRVLPPDGEEGGEEQTERTGPGGTVSIAAGEIAVFEKVLLGTKFQVWEDEASLEGCEVAYDGEAVTSTIGDAGNTAICRIQKDAENMVAAINMPAGGTPDSKVMIHKAIPADDITEADGAVAGIFKVSGTDLNGIYHEYTQVVQIDEFDPDSGMMTGSVQIEGIPYGRYCVEEIETGRFALESLKVDDSETLEFELSEDMREVTVESLEGRRSYGKFSDASYVRNRVGGSGTSGPGGDSSGILSYMFRYIDQESGEAVAERAGKARKGSTVIPGNLPEDYAVDGSQSFTVTRDKEVFQVYVTCTVTKIPYTITCVDGNGNILAVYEETLHVPDKGTSGTVTPGYSFDGYILSGDDSFTVSAGKTNEITLTYITEQEHKLNQELEQIISSMTVEEKVAQLFVIVPEALASNAQTTTTAAFGSALAKYPVGGIIYMSANIKDPAQITEALSKASQYAESACKFPLILSLDEEGGRVARIGNNTNFTVTKIKPMREIGDSGDTAKAYAAGDTIGSYLQGYGFNMDFAPVLDTITNPNNTVIGNRSFGTDPELVWSMASQVSAGLKKHGIISCYKHFPNHGSTEGDTHAGYAYTSKTLEELKAEDLVPFKAAVDAGCDCIMAAHISVPNVVGDDTPTSMSKVMLTDILRDDLGYQGVIITDALGMGAVSNNYSSGEAALGAFQAGADLLLMPKNFQEAYNAVLAAVKEGRISQERLDASIYRIGKMKLSR